MTAALAAGGLVSFLFGLIVGSFLNVVIFRYNSGALWRRRSQCLHCGAVLSVRDLVPVVSFVALRGRCRLCGSGLSYQYPLVEILTALIFTALFYQIGFKPVILLVTWLAAGVLIVIAGYDLKHKIIPQGLVYLLMIVGLAGVVASRLGDWPWLAIINLLAHHVVAGLMFYYAFWFIYWLSGGRAMGLGDAKLALGVGFLLGIARGLTAIIVGFWLGALVALALVALSRSPYRPLLSWSQSLKINWKSELPFAPFLASGVLIVLITGLNVIPL